MCKQFTLDVGSQLRLAQADGQYGLGCTVQFVNLALVMVLGLIH